MANSKAEEDGKIHHSSAAEFVYIDFVYIYLLLIFSEQTGLGEPS